MAKVLAVANQKGGTGKTTTTLNLGAALCEQGKRVLLIDFDPQGALTLAHGLDPLALDRTVYEALVDESVSVPDIIMSTEEGPDIAPANLNLSGAEVELLGEIGREAYLRDALEPVRDAYDVVLIDCPPSLGLLTINALTAADEVLIPVQLQFFALRALSQLLLLARKVTEKANPALRIGGFLPTMYQTGTRHSQEVLAELQEQYPDMVYGIVIKKTVQFPDSVIVSVEDFNNPPQPHSILQFAPRSEHADAYRALSEEVV